MRLYAGAVCQARLTMFCLWPPIEFPQPIISLAVEPKSKGDEDKMGVSLQRLVEEDPTLRVHRATEMKQTIISGMGESHLEITADRLRRKFSVDVVLGTPRVPYRETIRAKAKAQGRYVKQTGGHGQYGVCFIDIEPLSRRRSASAALAAGVTR